MVDHYRNGFEDGYGRTRRYRPDDESPQTDDEKYSYRTGRYDGQRRRTLSEELERDYFGIDD